MSDIEVEGGTSPPSALPPTKPDDAMTPSVLVGGAHEKDGVQFAPALSPPPRFLARRTIPIPLFSSNAEAALYWAHFGPSVIPMVPGEKRPAVSWDPWLAKLTPESIVAHWAEHPEHDVGCILGDDLIVLDADSPEAEQAILGIEEHIGVRARLVVRTRRGSHRYYQLAADTFAKSDSHSTAEHPDRIDVKTGRASVVVPPSGGREIVVLEAAAASELSIVGQHFVDAVATHDGRPVPRPPVPRPTMPDRQFTDLGRLEKLLDVISSDCGYDDWLRILAAIYHDTNGSDEGLALADRWSSKGVAYKGFAEVETKWRSFNSDVATPVTIGTLVKMARDAGADVHAIMHGGDEDFEPCEYTLVELVDQGPNALLRYSLMGMSQEIERSVSAQLPLLGELALSGQATVFYAAPNSGKTLITLRLLIDAIRQGRVVPDMTFYVNVDDTSSGLLQKLRLAEDYGFHMLAEGYRGFKASEFAAVIMGLVEAGQARGVIVILDTLKKFTDLMDKSRSSRFTEVIRGFVLKGGTVIALAHTNKNPGRDGRPVHAGTSDILDDFDCGYVLSVVTQAGETRQKMVEFTHLKRRGDVAPTAAFSYAVERGIPYDELLRDCSQII